MMHYGIDGALLACGVIACYAGITRVHSWQGGEVWFFMLSSPGAFTLDTTAKVAISLFVLLISLSLVPY